MTAPRDLAQGTIPAAAFGAPETPPRAPRTRRPIVDLRLVAEPRSIRHVLRLLRPRLRDVSAPDAADHAELVLAEVLNNIAEHGYCGAGGPISLRIRHRLQQLDITVADAGRPISAGLFAHLPTGPRPPSRPTAAADPQLPEGGFGLGIISHLSASRRYRRHLGQNVLRLRLHSEGGMPQPQHGHCPQDPEK